MPSKTAGPIQAAAAESELAELRAKSVDVGADLHLSTSLCNDEPASVVVRFANQGRTYPAAWSEAREVRFAADTADTADTAGRKFSFITESVRCVRRVDADFKRAPVGLVV